MARSFAHGALARRLAAIGTVALLVACAPAAPSTPTAPQQPAAQPAEKASTAAGKDSALQELIKAANAEGKLNIAGPSSLGDTNLQRIVAAMNQKYGTNIEATWNGAGQAGPVVAQIITEIATGGPTTWDIFITNDGQKVKLFTAGALEERPYAQLFGIDQRRIGLDGTAVGFANQLVLPAYNTNLVEAADAPKSWDDVVDPKWKGKLGVSTSVHHLVRLSQQWGHEKTTEYAQKIAALEPKLGQLNETYQRLVLGEIQLSFTQTNSQIEKGIEKGEPVAWAMDVRPAIGTWYYCGVNKNSPNANAAALFCGFMADQAAFSIWAENQGRQNFLDPTTDAGKIFAEDPNNLLLPDKDFMINELEEREKVYTPILGFR